MEFGIEKCAMFVMKCSKWHLTDGMELPNQDKIGTLEEKETDKNLGILESNTIKQVKMKKKKKEKKRISQENQKANRDISLVRYSGPFLKWTKQQEN